MPKRKDIKKILVIGAGPIIIGQACEFDYSGTQACKALKDEGYKVILINSNPATIMTDPGVADKTYIEPITLEILEKISDLNKHRFISFGKGAPSPVYNPDWALKLGIRDGKKRKTIMKVNSVMGLLLAVESGVGLAALPEYLVSNSINIIKVLPSSEGPITEAHFVYPQSLKNTARVQAFRNFLFTKIGDWK